MHRSRTFLSMIAGLAALSALTFAAPALIVVAAVALPAAFLVDRLLVIAAPIWADLARWPIVHLSRLLAPETYGHQTSIDFPPPQTGRPGLTAFA